MMNLYFLLFFLATFAFGMEIIPPSVSQDFLDLYCTTREERMVISKAQHALQGKDPKKKEIGFEALKNLSCAPAQYYAGMEYLKQNNPVKAAECLKKAHGYCYPPASYALAWLNKKNLPEAKELTLHYLLGAAMPVALPSSKEKPYYFYNAHVIKEVALEIALHFAQNAPKTEAEYHAAVQYTAIAALHNPDEPLFQHQFAYFFTCEKDCLDRYGSYQERLEKGKEFYSYGKKLDDYYLDCYKTPKVLLEAIQSRGRDLQNRDFAQYFGNCIKNLPENADKYICQGRFDFYRENFEGAYQCFLHALQLQYPDGILDLYHAPTIVAGLKDLSCAGFSPATSFLLQNNHYDHHDSAIELLLRSLDNEGEKGKKIIPFLINYFNRYPNLALEKKLGDYSIDSFGQSLPSAITQKDLDCFAYVINFCKRSLPDASLDESIRDLAEKCVRCFKSTPNNHLKLFFIEQAKSFIEEELKLRGSFNCTQAVVAYLEECGKRNDVIALYLTQLIERGFVAYDHETTCLYYAQASRISPRATLTLLNKDGAYCPLPSVIALLKRFRKRHAEFSWDTFKAQIPQGFFNYLAIYPNPTLEESLCIYIAKSLKKEHERIAIFNNSVEFSLFNNVLERSIIYAQQGKYGLLEKISDYFRILKKPLAKNQTLLLERAKNLLTTLADNKDAASYLKPCIEFLDVNVDKFPAVLSEFLAQLYQKGEAGCPQDNAEAFKYYEKIAKSSAQAARWCIGYCLETDNQSERAKVEVFFKALANYKNDDDFEILRSAAENGNIYVAYALFNYFYEKNIMENALSCWYMAQVNEKKNPSFFKNLDEDLQRNLSKIKKRSIQEIKKRSELHPDYACAYGFSQIWAEQDDPSNGLSLLLEGIKFVELAQEKGHDLSKYSQKLQEVYLTLGKYYVDTANIRESIKYFHKAHEHGSQESVKMLYSLNEKLARTTSNNDESLEFQKRALNIVLTEAHQNDDFAREVIMRASEDPEFLVTLPHSMLESYRMAHPYDLPLAAYFITAHEGGKAFYRPYPELVSMVADQPTAEGYYYLGIVAKALKGYYSAKQHFKKVFEFENLSEELTIKARGQLGLLAYENEHTPWTDSPEMYEEMVQHLLAFSDKSSVQSNLFVTHSLARMVKGALDTLANEHDTTLLLSVASEHLRAFAETHNEDYLLKSHEKFEKIISFLNKKPLEMAKITKYQIKRFQEFMLSYQEIIASKNPETPSLVAKFFDIDISVACLLSSIVSGLLPVPSYKDEKNKILDNALLEGFLDETDLVLSRAIFRGNYFKIDKESLDSLAHLKSLYLLLLGRFNYFKGEYECALSCFKESFERASEDSPNKAMSLNDLGLLSIRMGQVTEGMSHLEKAFYEYNGEHTGALLSKLYHEGLEQATTDSGEKKLVLPPDPEKYKKIMESILTQTLSEHVKSEEGKGTVFYVQGSHEADWVLGLHYFHADNYLRALEYLTKESIRNRYVIESPFLRALTYFKCGTSPEALGELKVGLTHAEQILRKVKRINPEVGTFLKALKLITDYLKIQPSMSEVQKKQNLLLAAGFSLVRGLCTPIDSTTVDEKIGLIKSALFLEKQARKMGTYPALASLETVVSDLSAQCVHDTLSNAASYYKCGKNDFVKEIQDELGL